MASEWYVERDGETFGPFTHERMIEGIRDGELKPEDLVWREGMLDWQLASNAPGLWLPPPPLLSATTAIGARVEPESTQELPPIAEAGTATAGSGDRARSLGPEVKAHSKPGFILRHWRGELTLAQAYWGVGLLLSLVVVWFSSVFGSWLGHADLSTVGTGIALMSLLSFLCVMTIWQIVGIWRAAGNHITSTGRRTWAILARVAMILSAVRAVVEFSTVIWPMLSESAILASGRDDIPAHRLRLLRNGTEVELAGGMPFGTADALRKLLDAAPAVRVIHLNSIGGRTGESYKIYQFVRERKLATYTATDCVSACTIAFLGGSQRYLSAKGRLGFHSTSFGGVDQRLAPEINADMRRMLATHGAPAWFIDKALTTPADSMWYPPATDLIAAKIVTQIVDSDQFALSGALDWHDEEAHEHGLLQSNPLYVAIRDSDPDGFKKISSRFSEAVRLGKSQPEIIGDIQAALLEILPKYLQVAPDGAIQRYWQTQVAEMEHLNKTDPAFCVAFAFPELRRADFNISKIVPPALLDQDVAALTDLIKITALTPHREKTGNIDDELAGVMARISGRIPIAQEVIAQPSKYFNDPRTLCTVVIAFYKEILNLAPQRAGQVLRSFAEPTP